MAEPATARPVDACLIGAGLSGLVAARELAAAGLRVTVLEAARRAGGRLETRRVGRAQFDTGAQFFTVRSAAFSALVETWRDEGCPIREWTRGFLQSADIRTGPSSARDGADGYPRYVVDGGMDVLAGHLARNLEVRTGHRATAVEPRGARVVVRSEADQVRSDVVARMLVLTPPVPETLAFLGSVALPAPVSEALRTIEYDPCVALLVSLDGQSPLPEPGGVQFGGGPVQWMADNAAKGLADVPAVTVHAAADWSRASADADAAAVAAALLDLTRPWLAPATVREVMLRRWGHSRPSTPHEERSVACDLDGARLVFCGDAFGGPKVEGAALSGLAAAQALLEG